MHPFMLLQWGLYLYHVTREFYHFVYIPKCFSLSLYVAPLNIFYPKTFFKLRTCFLQQQSSIYPPSNLRYTCSPLGKEIVHI